MQYLFRKRHIKCKFNLMEAYPKTTMVWSNGLTTICRLCMQHDGFLLAIFNNHSTVGTSEHRSIQRKIAECTALEVGLNKPVK